MGAIVEAILAYGQPLIDQTDGSEIQLNHALQLTQLCFNMARMPEQNRDKVLREMQAALKMDDAELEDFKRSVVVPMIRRHEEMFPRMHGRMATEDLPQASPPAIPSARTSHAKGSRREAYPGTDRYAPCPCNSGKKYKFCCGKTGS
jgi:uncharacterized protein YecA (UPF0149 family)